MLAKEKLGYLFVIAAMLIWGSIGVIVKLIPYPSELIVFYRVLFAFAFLLLLVIKRRKSISLKNTNKLLLTATGIMLALNWVFFFRAVKTTTVASATLSYYTAPILATLFSSLFLGEKLTGRGITALVLSFSGIGVMFFNASKLKLASWEGISFGLLAAFFYALFMISNKVITNLPAWLLTFIQTGITMLILLPIIWSYPHPGGKSLFWLIILGTVHTALALILYIKGLRLSKIQDVGVLSYLDPASAILFALIFLQEIPTPGTLVGGGLILAASYLVISSTE